MNKISRAYFKGLIAEDRLDDSINELRQLLSNYLSVNKDSSVGDTYDALILFAGKLKKIKNETIIEIIDPKDAARETTKIWHSLLSLINGIPEAVFEHQAAASGKNETLHQGVTEINRLAPTFRAIHPLQPATHFCGRKDLLQDFTNWWNDPLSPDRVRSLIAIGGRVKLP